MFIFNCDSSSRSECVTNSVLAYGCIPFFKEGFSREESLFEGYVLHYSMSQLPSPNKGLVQGLTSIGNNVPRKAAIYQEGKAFLWLDQTK